jgi:hypothetical protein
MKTSKDEQIARIVLGLGVMFVGNFSFIQITIAGYLIGLMLIGIGLVPHATEYPEDFVKAVEKAPAAVAKAVAPKKAVKKKVARKK